MIIRNRNAARINPLKCDGFIHKDVEVVGTNPAIEPISKIGFILIIGSRIHIDRVAISGRIDRRPGWKQHIRLFRPGLHRRLWGQL